MARVPAAEYLTCPSSDRLEQARRFSDVGRRLSDASRRASDVGSTSSSTSRTYYHDKTGSGDSGSTTSSSAASGSESADASKRPRATTPSLFTAATSTAWGGQGVSSALAGGASGLIRLAHGSAVRALRASPVGPVSASVVRAGKQRLASAAESPWAQRATLALRRVEISRLPDVTGSERAQRAWMWASLGFMGVCLVTSLLGSAAGHTRRSYWTTSARVHWVGNGTHTPPYRYSGLPALGANGLGGEWGFVDSLENERDRFPVPRSGGGHGADRDARGRPRSHAKPDYYTPFNPDDLTLTEEQCDAAFPGLWKEIDRSVDFFTNRQKFDKQYLEASCDDGIWTHARVVVYQNRLYIKYYRQSDFTRSQAALALLYLAIVSSRERLPNVEFCIGMMDWGSKGKFSLDRAPELEDVWLMPDYGWFSWPEHVGSYQAYRERTANVEREVAWEDKYGTLFWRGSMKVGTADRESLASVADGYAWSDVKPVTWDSGGNAVAMEDHCRWKFLAFPEGNTYSGRLRYLQNCRSVIVTHQPRWLQHWTHLYNADWNSPEQNIVFMPPPNKKKGGPGVLVHDAEGRESYDRTWEKLPEVMHKLLVDDARARRIANNQWNFFRERYISPASAACYWRKLLWGFSKVQLYDVDLSGDEKSYEGFVLKGMERGPHAL